MGRLASFSPAALYLCRSSALQNKFVTLVLSSGLGSCVLLNATAASIVYFPTNIVFGRIFHIKLCSDSFGFCPSLRLHCWTKLTDVENFGFYQFLVVKFHSLKSHQVQFFLARALCQKHQDVSPDGQ